ncbi:beta-phosphoglucomutase family hydrolase [Flammeovirga pectinis]|uniref:Beta-phosphoglucomutase family hydrolase n=1 Tax=Flammeovirga pectinis TaxID=2494373 RepID=A0A3S9P158_9BACT|nr:beta-phosphoglucomutase family hydrolase [Flammeovirga pectinis]AZQ61880.1 beta-phosphoglucomutase family hydrolase [Flammeovirga pectinis]
MSNKKIEIPSDVKGLIFDMDGTLADTMPTHYLAWKATFAKVGYHFSEEEFYSLAGMSTERIVLKIAAENNMQLEVQKMSDDKEQEYLNLTRAVKPIDIVFDIAKKYKGKLPMAIGTGNIKLLIDHTLEAIDAVGMFDALVGADDVSEPKPSPETFLKCADLINVLPKDCIVFEDGQPGIDAALAAGMKVVDVREYL